MQLSEAHDLLRKIEEAPLWVGTWFAYERKENTIYDIHSTSHMKPEEYLLLAAMMIVVIVSVYPSLVAEQLNAPILWTPPLWGIESLLDHIGSSPSPAVSGCKTSVNDVVGKPLPVPVSEARPKDIEASLSEPLR